MNDEKERAPLGPFGEIDPTLNVFALANGMDLKKDPAARRLEWYSDGCERGIVISVQDAERFRVDVAMWSRGSEEAEERTELASELAASDVTRLLHSAIDAANGL